MRNVTRPCQLGFDKNLSNQVCVSLDLLLNRSLSRYSNLSPTNIREQRRWVTSHELLHRRVKRDNNVGSCPCWQWCANGCNNTNNTQATSNFQQFQELLANKVGAFSRGLRFLHNLRSKRFRVFKEQRTRDEALVSFLARPKPKISFLSLSLLRNQTETLATQASIYTVRFHLRRLFQLSV